MCERENPNGEPWIIFCETCGWVILGLSWETVRNDVREALKRINETKKELTSVGQQHDGHELKVTTPGSPD